jgi:hypothetical protein
MPYKDKAKAKELSLAATKKWQRKYVEIVRLYKLIVGCQDCGYRERAEALEFDHRPGTVKLFGIADRMTTLAKLIAEAEKCDVVCANCHAIRTADRFLNA